MAARPPPPGPPPGKAATGNGPSLGAPNQTLYCSNLPDKLQKQDLRRSLYFLFSTYGPVLDVVALKTSKMRGQAHIVFRDVQASTQALRSLQGFEFFGKEMQIAYGKGKSDTIAKLDGTFKMPVSAAAAAAGPSTELQQSIFNAPPPAAAKGGAADVSMGNTDGVQKGQKRARDEDEEDADQSMEEDEGDAMEESDED